MQEARAGEKHANGLRPFSRAGATPRRWTASPLRETTRRAPWLQLANVETLGAALAAGLEVVLEGATVERVTGDGRAPVDWLGLRGA